MRIRYWLLLATCLRLTACSTTTVYIARHGEKVNDTDTTSLTPAGHTRAIALANTLADKSIDSIFSTPYRRTRQTAQPLADRLKVSVVDYPAKPVEAISNRIARIQNKNVLVVGHSNTILEIAQALGAKPAMTKIESGDFDNLLQVKIRRSVFGKSIRFSQTTYGVPTSP